MNPNRPDFSAAPVRASAAAAHGGPVPEGKAGRMNLLQLPRKEPYVNIDVERSFRESGCHICRQVIAKGDIRLAIDIALLDVREDRLGHERTQERYYVHGRCVVEALEGRDPRPFRSCWDCAKVIDDRDDTYAVFTTHRFAYSRLCYDCVRKPRWTICAVCNVAFPHWMVAFTRDDQRLCDWCSEKTGNETRRIVDQRKHEFQQLRDDILKEGI